MAQSINSFLEEYGFFLHHSPNSNIPIGETIKTSSLSAHQVTASDAVGGYSYAWDAQTGVKDSVINQVSNRTKMVDSLDENIIKSHSVYLTRAPSAEVFPDVNVPGTAARAIKGEGVQTILDKVSIPANLSDQEAIDLVQEMVDRAGVPRLSQNEAVAKNLAYVISDKGSAALKDFEEAQGERFLKLKEGQIQPLLDTVLSGEKTMDQLGWFREEAEALSTSKEVFRERYLSEAAEKLGKQKGTIGDIIRSGMFTSMSGRDQKMQAAISSITGTSAEKFVGKPLAQISIKGVEQRVS